MFYGGCALGCKGFAHILVRKRIRCTIRQNVFDRSAPEDLTFFCKSLFFLQKCGYNISVDGWFDGSWMIFSKHFSKLCQCIYPREGTATPPFASAAASS